MVLLPTFISGQGIQAAYPRPFIVDFFCPKARLIIELDGSQHFMPEGQSADEARTGSLESRGYAVLRFPNAQVDRHFPEVCEAIHNSI